MPSNEANDREFRTMTPMQPEPLANSICIRREDPLVVPPQNSDCRIAIRVSDWRRIKAKLSRGCRAGQSLPRSLLCALRLLWISPLIRDSNRSGAWYPRLGGAAACLPYRSEEHTSELQS